MADLVFLPLVTAPDPSQPLRHRGWGIIAAVLLLVSGIAALPLAAQTAYPRGTPLLADSGSSAPRLTNTTNARLTTETVAGPGFTQAWRIETTRDSTPPWAIELKRPTLVPVVRNGVALVRFYARSIASTDESGQSRLRVVVQKSSADWNKSLDTEIYLGPAWTEVLLPFSFAADFAAGGAELSFGFGFKRQTLEIAGLDGQYYAQTQTEASLPRTKLGFYAGREAGAAWRTAALERIARLRQGDFTVRAVAADGQPLHGATVRVAMKRHHFQWGSCYVMSRLAANTTDNQMYRRKLLELFNAGSTENDLKWGPWDGLSGSGYNRTQTLAGLRWLRDHGLGVRGHVLVWPSWKNLPSSISQLQNTPGQADIPARVLAHIADIVGATRDYVEEWDVLNEPYTNHDLMDVFGAGIQVDWFKAARAAHPTARLFLNDYSNHDATRDAEHVNHFEATAKYLLAQGAPLGGLGIQAHFGGSPSGPAAILATFDRYAALGLPLRITEFDVDSDDEDLQADFTRDFLIACFSHPSVIGVQHWGFWSKAHWKPAAAMYRDDWSEKPNGQAYRQLVLDQWFTRAGGTTDAAGEWRGRGYHGEYIATLEYQGKHYEKNFSLLPGAERPLITLTPVDTRLANLSTRVHVGAGDQIAITGLTLTEPGDRTLLFRAVGPGLSAYGVTGVLAQPYLVVMRGATPLAANRGWESSPSPDLLVATSRRVGAFALAPGSADCALTVTLGPGVYTVQVSGADGGTGVCLIEAYDAGN